MTNELTTNFDMIPDGEDTLIIAKLADLLVGRSYRYHETLADLRNRSPKSVAVTERKHKMKRSAYEDMARYVWGAAKQSKLSGAHDPKTLLAIICGVETEGFLNLKTKTWASTPDPMTR